MNLYWAIDRVLNDPGILARRAQRLVTAWLGSRPSSSPYISGDSFRAFSRHIWDETGEFNPHIVEAGDIIFCKSDLLENFCAIALPHIVEPIVLILGNSDRNFTEAPKALATSKARTSVFAQNLVRPIPGFSPLPIGLENLRWRDVGRPRDFDKTRRRIEPRVFRVMWTFNLSTNRPVRKKARDTLREVAVADELGAVSPSSHRRALAKYGFVASPPGNGWDTHRTWEALYLGCIPIVFDSEFSRNLAQKGLPLWVVKSFSELVDMNEGDLRDKYLDLNRGFYSDHLWLDSWKDAILMQSDTFRSLKGGNSP